MWILGTYLHICAHVFTLDLWGSYMDTHGFTGHTHVHAL